MKIKEAVETLYSYGVEYEDINEATDTLLTAYEKEKEKNKDLKEGYKIQEHNYQVAMEEIEQRWKDKIIAKVIEIKDKPVEDEFITATQGKLNTIIDIEKLLDEEETMLSDVEKKKYEEIKYNNRYLYCDKEDVDCLIDIIEKQSKEIEELKAHQIIFTNDYKPIGSKGRKFISEDKIKAKIEEVENQKERYIDIIDDYNTQICDCIIEELQSLLEKE